MEGEPDPLRGETHGQVQFPPGRVRSHADGRELRPALLRLLPLEGQGREGERHHGTEQQQPLPREAEREGRVARPRGAGGRGEHGIRRGHALFLAGREYDVLQLLRTRPRRAAHGGDLYFLTQQRQVGQGHPGDDREGLRDRLGASLHLAGWQVPLLRFRRRRGLRRERPLPGTRGGQRFRADGEPGRGYQHAGRRDVPVRPGFGHALLRFQRASRHGRPRSFQGDAGQHRPVARGEHGRAHQLHGGRLRHHLRRQGGAGILQLQPQRRPRLRPSVFFRATDHHHPHRGHRERRGRVPHRGRHHPHRREGRAERESAGEERRDVPSGTGARHPLRDDGERPRLSEPEF